MPSERAIVETLNRKELLDLVSHFELDVADRRVRDHLVDAIAQAPEVTLAQVLEKLPVATLKTVCGKHGVDVEGRGKAAYVASIAAAATPKARGKARIKAVSAPKAKAAKVDKAAKATKKPAAKAAKATKKSVSLAKPAAKVAKAAKKTATSVTKAVAKPAAKAAKAPKATKVAKAPKAAKAPKVGKPSAKKAAFKSQLSAVENDAVLADKPASKAKAPKPAKAKALKPAKSVAAKARKPNTDVAIHAVAAESSAGATKAPASKAKSPAVKKAKSVALPQAPVAEAEASLPTAPPPSNVIKLPYVNTPAAVAAAEAAAAHLRATSDPALWAQPTTRTQKCASCAIKLDLRKCTVQKCSNMLIASPTRKICAECMFERNTLSMDDFNVRMEEEASCPHCGNAWQHN